MHKGIPLALTAALAACYARPAETSELLGRWTWEGNDCSKANLEITHEAVIFTAANGERGALYEVLPVPSDARGTGEYMMHLRLLPHRTMPLDHQRRLLAGEGQMALLFKVEERRLTPLIVGEHDGAKILREDDPTYQLFNVVRCS